MSKAIPKSRVDLNPSQTPIESTAPSGLNAAPRKYSFPYESVFGTGHSEPGPVSKESPEHQSLLDAFNVDPGDTRWGINE